MEKAENNTKRIDKPTIVFRADGSASMGLGHIFRSAALAEILRESYEPVLLSKSVPSGLIERLGATFARIVQLNEDAQIQEERSLIGELYNPDGEHMKSGSIIVLDGYHFTSAYQRALHDAGYKIVAIDDIHSTHFYANLIINHAPVQNLADRYSSESYTSYALGPAFSLLRPAYLNAAQEMVGRLAHAEQKEHFFICFGGADPENVTTALIRKLIELGSRFPLQIVLGPANAFRAEVQDACRDYPGATTVHQSLEDSQMIALYRKSIAAFLPASTIMIEALSLGVSVVGGYYVENQREIYSGFVEANMIHGIGDWLNPIGLQREVEKVTTTVREQERTGRSHIDPYSNINLKLLFDQLAAGGQVLVGRPAVLADSQQYFDWANDPSARANAINTLPIPRADHEEWYAAKIKSNDCLLLIYFFERRPCGQLRYDIAGGTATISFTVGVDLRGKGFGTAIVRLSEKQLRSRHQEVDTILALVRPNNIPSKRTFIRCGFLEDGSTTERGVDLLRFIKKV